MNTALTPEQIVEVVRLHGMWWRNEERGVRANLGGANLSDANLSDADLRGADLSDANLGGANLSDANLRGADLRGADLSDANLGGADLRGADLSDANLGGADLRGADLRGADLSDADLSDADLRGADLRGADLSDADLSDANLRGADLGGALQRIVVVHGSRHVIVAIDADVRIGCERHPIAEWLARFEAIGASRGYTPEQIAEYGLHLRHIAAVLALGWPAAAEKAQAQP